MYKEMLQEFAELAKEASPEELNALAQDVLAGLNKIAEQMTEDQMEKSALTEHAVNAAKKAAEIAAPAVIAGAASGAAGVYARTKAEELEGTDKQASTYSIEELIKSAGMNDDAMSYVAPDSISEVIKQAGTLIPDFMDNKPANGDDSDGSVVGGVIGTGLAVGAGALGIAGVKKGTQGYHAAMASLGASNEIKGKAAKLKHQAALKGQGLGAAPEFGGADNYNGGGNNGKPLYGDKKNEFEKKLENRVSTKYLDPNTGEAVGRDVQGVRRDLNALNTADFISKNKVAIGAGAAAVGTTAYLANQNKKKDAELNGAYGVGRR